MNQEVGRQATEFHLESVQLGILHLYVKAIDRETSVKVFVSTSILDDDFYPKLPRHGRLEVTSVTSNSVSVQWPAVVPQSSDLPNTQYCIILTREEKIENFCELDENLHHFENLQFSKSNQLHENSLKPATKPDRYCMVNKLRYEFRGLQPNTEYHVSLFAVNPVTDGSVAFGSASFRTDSENSDSGGGAGGAGGDSASGSNNQLTINLMKDATTFASYLNPTRGTFQLYEYPVKHFIRELMIHIQPCSGYIRVKIFKDGKLVRTGTTEMLKTFQLQNLKPISSIEIKVENDDNDAKIYRIWASEFSTSDPYPKLPVDTSVKVLEHSRTCNSVTLAWLGTNFIPICNINFIPIFYQFYTSFTPILY